MGRTRAGGPAARDPMPHLRHALGNLCAPDIIHPLHLEFETAPHALHLTSLGHIQQRMNFGDEDIRSEGFHEKLAPSADRPV